VSERIEDFLVAAQYNLSVRVKCIDCDSRVDVNAPMPKPGDLADASKWAAIAAGLGEDEKLRETA
jgi:hypothetical protein